MPNPIPFTEPVEIGYVNWRGEFSMRRIVPLSLGFYSTEWHPEPQWMLKAWDAEKDADRDFALKDFRVPATPSSVTAERVEPTEEECARHLRSIAAIDAEFGPGVGERVTAAGKAMHAAVDGADAEANSTESSRAHWRWLALVAFLAHPKDGWRDIATAPKDGTWIELWRAPTTSEGIWWAPRVVARWNQWPELDEAGWVWSDDDTQDVWSALGRERAERAIANGDYNAAVGDNFTHWMPLPEAPTLGEE